MTGSNLHVPIILLVILIGLSAFFSSAETAMMAINRYRLRYLARKKHKMALMVSDMLERPDRLLGVILIGNTFANIGASAVATMVGVQYFGKLGITIITAALTLFILIFGEVMPKTLAAFHPERIAFPVAWPLKMLMNILYPLVLLVNIIANGCLRLFGLHIKSKKIEALSAEELRGMVYEASGKISRSHQDMLLGVFDLTKAKVENIMVPRTEMLGIDLNNEWPSILAQLTTSEHTRLPLYYDSIDNVQGILHLRRALNLLAKNELNKHSLQAVAQVPYFVPAGTPLNVQLIEFQRNKTRVGLVVDEYGHIQGLVTLEDILEEVIGEFTTNLVVKTKPIQAEKNGSFVIDASLSIRDINKQLNWHLPTNGPNTLNGLIIEYLEAMPIAGLALKVADHPVEILEVKDNKVCLARIWPQAE